MNRFVFISVLMMLSLTAAAGRHAPDAVADTSVIPVKAAISGRPLAEKLDSKSGEKKVVAGRKTGTGSSGITTAKKLPAGTTKKTTANLVKTKPTTTTNSSTKTTTTAKKSSPSKISTSKTSKTSKTSSKTTKSKSRKLRKGIGIELFTPLAFKYAILLDVPVEKVTEDDKLLEVLDHWYGTRYRYGGETRKGIDCSAFTQAFMASYFDYELPRTAEEQYAKCKHIKKKKLRQGDLVFFKTRGSKGGISHVGVYLLNNRFVHSATSTGVRISNLNDDYYKAKYAGAGRIK